MEPRPIPAFYCCYLLRSTNRRSSLYVGSTPNPPRRLAQHNGKSKGGAVRTSRKDLRPWEMACIVSGFPSNIAALQFEWAWRNSHVTKRIAPASRKTGRPRLTLNDKFSNLHILLRAPSFERWPMKVQFFCQDVYEVWQRQIGKFDGEIRKGIDVIHDARPPSPPEGASQEGLDDNPRGKRKRDGHERSGIEALAIDYRPVKGHLGKSLSLLADGELKVCKICSQELETQPSTTLVCPSGECRTAWHMTCLAAQWLRHEASEGPIVPTNGKCLSCKTDLQWADLVRELTLRTRGVKEVARLLKKPRKLRENAAIDDITTREQQDTTEHDLTEDEDDPLPDDWHCSEGDEDADEVGSLTSSVTDLPEVCARTSNGKTSKKKLQRVIEDSEWDDAEVLD